MRQNKSSWLYKDKELTKELTTEDLERAESRVVYFYDGNNGDKHVIIRYCTKYNGEIDEVLALNLYQSYLSGKYTGYKNANEAARRMKVPENGNELIGLFNNIELLKW